MHNQPDIDSLQKEYLDFHHRQSALESFIVFHELEDLEVFAAGEYPLGEVAHQIIRSPILRLGKWQRGKRRFECTQADIDTILTNFKERALGFEPPLFLGHPSDILAVEGAPAVGFLVRLFQQADVLWGDFEVVDEAAFTAVEKGRYRYASAELWRNTTHPITGEPISIMLVGHSLTNRPFIPFLPRNEVWKNGEPLSIVVDKNGESMTQESTIPPTELKEDNSMSTSESQKLDVKEFERQLTEMFAVQLEQVKLDFQQQLDALKAENAVVSQQLAAAQAELNTVRIQKRLAELDSMNLAKPVKEKYRELVEKQSLGEHEETVFEALRMMSVSTSKELFTQHGQENLTVKEQTTNTDNPYASQIEENERLASSLRQSALSTLYSLNR